MDALKAKLYEQSVLEEYLALPETTMAELIDGVIYNMASPSRQHQKILMELFLLNLKYRLILFWPLDKYLVFLSFDLIL